MTGQPGIRQVVQLLVEGIAQRHDPLRQPRVVLVLHRERHQLRRHRPELHRLGRQPLRRLEQLRILHLAAPDRPHQLRHHPRFQVVVQDVPARKRNAPRPHLRQLRMRRLEPAHVMRRITRPALPPDVLVEPAVPVRHDVQPRHLLLPQIHRQRVHILLPEPRRHHRVQERPRPQVFGIPAWPRQRPRDRRRQHLPGGGFQHLRVSIITLLLACVGSLRLESGEETREFRH